MEYFTDKHGITITTGCVIRFVAQVKTGERTSGRGRSKQHFSTYENKELQGVVRFGLYTTPIGGTLITYYIEIDGDEEYDTHFFSGIGWSRRERAKNEITRIKRNLSRPLTEDIALSCEVVGADGL